MDLMRITSIVVIMISGIGFAIGNFLLVYIYLFGDSSVNDKSQSGEEESEDEI